MTILNVNGFIYYLCFGWNWKSRAVVKWLAKRRREWQVVKMNKLFNEYNTHMSIRSGYSLTRFITHCTAFSFTRVPINISNNNKCMVLLIFALIGSWNYCKVCNLLSITSYFQCLYHKTVHLKPIQTHKRALEKTQFH